MVYEKSQISNFFYGSETMNTRVKKFILVVISICFIGQISLGIPSRMTPLKLAAFTGDPAKVKLLVDEGVDVNG